MGELKQAELSCPSGFCRVRYRFIAPSSGVLSVAVDGPSGSGPGSGGRIGRVILEGVGEQTLKIQNAEFQTGDLILSHAVQPGVHYVLIQGLGGSVSYTVEGHFKAVKGTVVEPGLMGESDAEKKTAAASASASSTAGPAGLKSPPFQLKDTPGNQTDGADFSYDPHSKLAGMKTYAFAQDPEEMLKGKPGSVKGNVFLLKQFQREVRYSLSSRGLRLVSEKEADFLIWIRLGAKTGLAYAPGTALMPNSFNTYFNDWASRGLYVGRTAYKDGTLEIDFVNRKTGALLWHGWTVEAVPIHQTDDSAIKQAVHQVLAQY